VRVESGVGREAVEVCVERGDLLIRQTERERGEEVSLKR